VQNYKPKKRLLGSEDSTDEINPVSPLQRVEDQEPSGWQWKVQLIGSWLRDLLLSAQSVVENEVYGANISLLHVPS
jgi:hypothetical protein